jgi:hypothetical protein
LVVGVCKARLLLRLRFSLLLLLPQVLGDVDAARSTLLLGLQHHAGCKQLWEGALWFEETLPGEWCEETPKQLLVLW